MVKYKTVYKCRECGATSYQRVIDRAQNGALVPTGQYRCTGCRNVFDNIRSWWEPRRAVADMIAATSAAASSSAFSPLQ